MTLHLQQRSIAIDKNILVAFFILLFLLGQFHQLLHHIVGGLLSGQVGYLTFDKHHFAGALSDSAHRKLATIAGPLVGNYAPMWIGMLLLRSGSYSLLGFSLIIASMPLGRLLAVLGGDEQYYGVWATQPFGSNEEYASIISLLLTLLILLPPLVATYRSLANKRRSIVFSSLLVLPLFFYTIFIMVPDHTLLVPSVLKSVETGTSANPLVSMIWGLPLILIITTAPLAALFFGKYLRYLLPKGKEVIIE